MLFIFSKIPELFDTAFIVLGKKKLIFLHWYHHVTVLLYCWHSYGTRNAAGLWFIAMNYTVHAIMYFYYFLTGLGYRPKWAFFVTIIQISQMFVGVMVCFTFFSRPYTYLIFRSFRTNKTNYKFMSNRFAFTHTCLNPEIQRAASHGKIGPPGL